ncbi:MAG TPA: VWA domain-containing protein [Thermoanaerobaculia bacterium]|jgi:VWFA-related protein|nr:VWA domain-containing protein [Thermoanaerobaculia bacterium]
MKKIALLGLVLVAGSLSVARAQEEAPELPVIGETIDVRVVNVEVVATSESGPVRGLAAGDFRLLVDGKEVPIEYFTEVENGTAAASANSESGPVAPVGPSEAIGRSYLVFIDESFSVAKPRDVVLANLEKDLELMQGEDQMAVLAFNGTTIDVLSPWTSDKTALAAALRNARQRQAHGNDLLAKNRSLGVDRNLFMEVAADQEFSAKETAFLLEDFDARVSPEARTQLGRTAQAMAGTLRGIELPFGRKVMLLLSGGWSLGVAPKLFGPVVTAANQLGYTIYPVDVANPTPQTLKMLDAVAAQTGGKVANSMKQDVFRTVVADSGTYYWLGFTPTWKANDQGHSIKIESRRSDVTLRSRSGFPDLSRKSENMMKAESVLLFGGTGGMENDRRLKILIGQVKPLGRKEIEIPVTVGVPVEALALTPSGKGYIAEAPLAVAALDGKGGRAEIPTAKLRVAVKEPFRAGGFARFQTTLRLSRAQQRLVFTVRDEVNGNTIWQEVDLQPDEKVAQGAKGQTQGE